MKSKLGYSKFKLLLRKFGHLEFIRFGLRDRLIRIFHSPDTATKEKFSVNFYGLKYPGELSCFLDWSVFYYGAYSKDELTILGHLIQASCGENILDIGANIGHHSLFFSTFEKNVHAFEPFEGVSRKLEEKIHVNNVKNITLHKIALGEKNETQTFYPSDNNNTGTGSFVNTKTKAKPLIFQIFKGDEFLATRNIKNIGLIKIDVEGLEIDVIKGLKDTLTKERPIVFFEWTQGNLSAENLSSNSLQNELFPQDYDFFAFIPSHPKFFLLSNRKTKLQKLQKLHHGFNFENLVAVPKEIRLPQQIL
ncbi:MAG: FkbM family methyltransferase [Candidatus Riflebacteria bacterium]|nr:FkbM family methyltransferase [Candidatus Riflebacteria bacterium]